MTTPRPICGHCGKPYGRRMTATETVRFPVGEEMPPFRGNGIVVKTSPPYVTTNRETVRALTMVTKTNKASVAEMLDKLPEKSEQVARREIWDGETWFGGYPPFCTLRCALDYARKAYAKEKRK